MLSVKFTILVWIAGITGCGINKKKTKIKKRFLCCHSLVPGRVILMATSLLLALKNCGIKLMSVAVYLF